ncbi:MAG: LPS export ABC transporter permease LptF [Rickettsiales bacterium]|nr:LPS export ABC transporter permease LptF [Rickettsiales bacterium]
MKHLAWPTLLITASLTCIIWLTQALRFIDFIINRGLSIGDFIYITSLLFPSLLMLLIPVSLFVAVTFTYNKLLVDSELIVLRAAGLSRWQLAKPAILVALVMTLFCYALSLYFLPLSNRQFNDMRTFLRDNYTSVLLQEEVFNTPVEGLTVFVRERDSEGQLYGILVHDNRAQLNPVTMMAEEGRLVQTDSGPKFFLVKGMRQEVRKGRISWLNFDEYTLDIRFYTGVMRQRDRDADEKYLGELFDTEGMTSKEKAHHEAEGHQRLVWPLYNLALTLLAVTILLSGEFNRRGQWKRILMAGISAIVVALCGVGLRNLVVKEPMMIPLMYVFVIGIFVGSAFFLFWHRKPSLKAAPEGV